MISRSIHGTQCAKYYKLLLTIHSSVRTKGTTGEACVRKKERDKREREGGGGEGKKNDRQPLLLRTFRVPLTTSLATRAVLPLLYDTCVYDESVCTCV